VSRALFESRDSSSRFRFERMGETHAREAAHTRALSRDFGLFSQMDVAFWELFFTTIAAGPTTIAHVAVDQDSGKLAGYIIGTTDASKMTRLVVQKHPLRLLWYGLKMLVLHPSQLRLVLRNVLARKDQIAIPAQRWITWVVAPGYREHGVGLELYKRLCADMHARGVSEFYGPVDCENVVSNKAHERIKAENLGTIIVDGRAHYLWKHRADLERAQ
jgi:hypothetical protein